ncbi:MAG: peptide chain release factor N(5)-glutamine methyltransferase [Candidatus Wildermuthbacteria bacterium]|nr:peptide chain release factor N(5)-glutamine methyltransferase [Candidatus Wildermuthbacteria bacterium]
MEEIRWLLKEKYKGKLTPQAKKDIAKLKKGEHVDYLIGWKPFLSCKIDLRHRPLIPRVETEYWVEKAILNLRSKISKVRCLDIFAGSGCIGVAVLKHIPGARVDFAEKEKKPLKQIALNAKLNRIAKSRYRIIQSNIFSKVKGKYDYIFANPPYLAESKRKKIQKSVLEQEPHSALFGGKDGLKYIRLFLRQSKEFLAKNGVIYLEFDSFQKTAIEKLLKKFGYSHWQFHKDQYGKWRFVVISS